MALFGLGFDGQPVSRVEVRVSPAGVSAEGKLFVGVRFEMDEGWHTYAENPGDSGMPPEIRIKRPEGGSVERWSFPPHIPFTDAAGTTYGYKGQVVLLGKLIIPDIKVFQALQPSEELHLTFDVFWMVCKDVCIPLQQEVKVKVPSREATAEEWNEWERFLEAGGWSACQEKSSGAGSSVK